MNKLYMDLPYKEISCEWFDFKSHVGVHNNKIKCGKIETNIEWS